MALLSSPKIGIGNPYNMFMYATYLRVLSGNTKFRKLFWQGAKTLELELFVVPSVTACGMFLPERTKLQYVCQHDLSKWLCNQRKLWLYKINFKI